MFFTQFGYLFANMEWYVLVLFIVGIVSLLIEFVQPGFGLFGILGSVCLLLSLVFRAVFAKPEDDVWMQVFQFLLLDVLILGILFVCLLFARKRGWFQKKIAQQDTAVSPSYSDGTKDFSFLVGKVGRSKTALRLSGKGEFDGVVYDVVSKEFWIENDAEITVIATEGGKIVVDKIIK